VGRRRKMNDCDGEGRSRGCGVDVWKTGVVEEYGE
jgi:hypothetical protein